MKLQISKKRCLAFCIALFLFTFLRSVLLILMPLLVLLLPWAYQINVLSKKNSIFIITAFLLVLIIQFFLGNVFLQNWLVSIVIFFLPLVYLLFPSKRQLFSLDDWFKGSSVVLVIVNITAFINYIYVFLTDSWLLDDAFVGIYGRSGLSMHTLCLINFIYGYYYFVCRNKVLTVFFFISAIMCFYGLGLLVFLGAIGIQFLRYFNLSLLKRTLFIIPLAVVGIMTINVVNSHIISYMNENITKVVQGVQGYSYEDQLLLSKQSKRTNVPRKITAFAGGFKHVEHPILFLLGTGPGTYNSRTSFLLNGEYSKVGKVLGLLSRPDIAEQEVYPLWNDKITYQYNDGTRNQPFSSFLALIIEYGCLIFILIVLLFYNLLKRLCKWDSYDIFYEFIIIFFLLNTLVENYVEYPEFMLLNVILIKCRDNYASITNT